MKFLQTDSIKLILTAGSRFFIYAIVFMALCRPAFCQGAYDPDTTGSNDIDGEFYQESDTTDYVYPDYYRITISPGFSEFDNLKLSTYSKQGYLNINYSISNFPQPLEYIPTQIGIYSEIGLYNTSVYLNAGPELRIKKHLYVIPYAGFSLVPFSKYNDEGMSFVYYIGASAGYIVNINEDIDIILEAATDFIKFKKDQNNRYFKIGISYNLFYPL